jgi:CxxC motif-containing protein
MTLTTSYLCIGCPLGCRLEVDEDEVSHAVVEVRGFSCKRGKEYALQEHVAPQRIVTTTVAIEGAAWPRLPVRTAGAVPKPLVADICRQLRMVAMKAPVQMGEIVMADVLDTGVDVVATCDMPKQQA